MSANDPGDPDFGANNFQNFPELTSAEVNNDGSTTIEGTLDSTSGTTFTVQFFASPSADPSNHGEGKVYRGQKTDVTTGAGGNASFSFTTQEDIGGQYVAATATSPVNDTSEFSEVEQVTEVNDAPVVETTSTRSRRTGPSRWRRQACSPTTPIPSAMPSQRCSSTARARGD